MDDFDNDDDDFSLAAAALIHAGLSAITGACRVDQADDGSDFFVIEHRGALTRDERDRVAVIMGDLPYVFEEVDTSAEGITSRVADRTVLHAQTYRKPD